MARSRSPGNVPASDARSPILSPWTDAFGADRTINAGTRAALRDALRVPPGGRRRDPDPIVLGRLGGPLPGRRELVLEDGTSCGTVSRIPRDVPFGYHLLRSDRAEQLLIVAPPRL